MIHGLKPLNLLGFYGDGLQSVQSPQFPPLRVCQSRQALFCHRKAAFFNTSGLKFKRQYVSQQWNRNEFKLADKTIIGHDELMKILREKYFGQAE